MPDHRPNGRLTKALRSNTEMALVRERSGEVRLGVFPAYTVCSLPAAPVNPIPS